MTQTPNNANTDADRPADLWSFALRCYAIEQAHLLSLQHNAGLHINDALVAAYAAASASLLDGVRWEYVRSGRPRQILLRVRRVRQSMKRSDPNRPRALDFELELERWDLFRLAGCVSGKGSASDEDRSAEVLSEQCDLSVDEVKALIHRLRCSAGPSHGE
ncbi:DUF2390 domain-containing protein [Saccharospirillum impatiens]|uniref:DUF2390 domain-containing protein n=1 Tax=Saccharospirillum impatiens TaxID=169438 RepID=UPI00146C4EC7|nr:DUF2390 domain-containing protein [Saccharospirillum impatiens]